MIEYCLKNPTFQRVLLGIIYILVLCLLCDTKAKVGFIVAEQIGLSYLRHLLVDKVYVHLSSFGII